MSKTNHSWGVVLETLNGIVALFADGQNGHFTLIYPSDAMKDNEITKELDVSIRHDDCWSNDLFIMIKNKKWINVSNCLDTEISIAESPDISDQKILDSYQTKLFKITLGIAQKLGSEIAVNLTKEYKGYPSTLEEQGYRLERRYKKTHEQGRKELIDGGEDPWRGVCYTRRGGQEIMLRTNDWGENWQICYKKITRDLSYDKFVKIILNYVGSI